MTGSTSDIFLSVGDLVRAPLRPSQKPKTNSAGPYKGRVVALINNATKKQVTGVTKEELQTLEIVARVEFGFPNGVRGLLIGNWSKPADEFEIIAKGQRPAVDTEATWCQRASEKIQRAGCAKEPEGGSVE